MLIRKGLISRMFFSMSKYDKNKDYYKMLGVARTAKDTEIKKAFHNLAKKYHPDVAKGNQAKFKQINEAYTVLSDQQTKRQYDGEFASGSSQEGPASGSYSTYRSSNNNSSQSFGSYGRSSSSSRPTNQQREEYQYYQQNYNYNDPDMRRTWENPSFQQQVIREFMRAGRARKANDTRSHQPRNDSNNFTSKSNTGSRFRNVYEEDPRWQSNSQEYIRNQYRYAEKEMERVRQQKESQQRLRKEQYEQQMKQQRQRAKAINQFKQDLSKAATKVAEKASDVAKKAWDWFTKK